MSEREWLVIGPPGTGKTTYLSRLARRGVEKWGAKGMLICSLTKAAAREAGGRDTGLADGNVGTLHAICHRQLNRPALVENKHLEDWNKFAPQYSLSGALSGDDEFRQRAEGDRLLARLDLLRSRMTPRDLWSNEVNLFYGRWQDWKNQSKLLDFTDLIELSLHTLSSLPDEVKGIGVDEVQDSSKLEIALVRQWSEDIEQTIFIGDPDQSLFHWRGADPDILRRDGMTQRHREHHDFDDDGELLLDGSGDKIGSVRCQSYRVPRAVHEVAVRLIERIPGRPKIDYKPTKEQGTVTRSDIASIRFEAMIPLVENTIDDGKTVMILCSCEFMLRPIIKILRELGIPYGNQYAERWNPLSSGGTRMADRIISFLKPSQEYFSSSRQFWTSEDVRRFAMALRSEGILKHGAKRRLQDLDTKDKLFGQDVAELIRETFEPDAMQDLSKVELEWYLSNLLAKDQEIAKFPVKILKTRGVQALTSQPKVCIGTIHSVKGGEADTVILFPDLSPQGYQQYRMPGWYGFDAVARMFYVAMTRAKETLIIGAPSGPMYANF